ncbi:carboxypeptidase-like regulatory domain-containing protein [Tenacibaculum sp. UWU-22]|uniref:carboxypeptidase-like regulatory domain-containing protein n=1 Tax=Tenacibaculum sp. UWU-22 TaxID=3234187 RepID=UPI0034DB2AE3
MQKQLILLGFLFLFSVVGFSQNTTQSKLKGQVVNAADQKALIDANILNLNTVQGIATSKKGFFELPAKENDTIIVSYVGFESIKIKITNDLLKGNELVIELNEKPEKIKEVVINSTKLIGVLEIDVKQVPKDKFTRIHINGLPQTYEIGRPTKISSPISKIFQPIDAIYNLFGKKPKQLKKLKKLKSEDNLRKMLGDKFDREIMMEYLEMDNQQLTKLLSDCNYSEYFIKKASDLQMIEAILDCYEQYKAVKKGKIERNRVPEKALNSDGN